VNIQRKKALQRRQITFSASELFDLYQSAKDAGGCSDRHDCSKAVIGVILSKNHSTGCFLSATWRD
jgi:hypothetical protein